MPKRLIIIEGALSTEGGLFLTALDEHSERVGISYREWSPYFNDWTGLSAGGCHVGKGSDEEAKWMELLAGAAIRGAEPESIVCLGGLRDAIIDGGFEL